MQNSKIDLVYKTSLRTIHYIIEDLQLGGSFDKFEVEKVDKIEFFNITTSISLTGDMNGVVFLSISDKLAKNLVKKFVYGTIKDSDVKELAYENVSETLNVTLGNVLASLKEVEEGGNIEISTPTNEVDKKTISCSPNQQFLSCSINYGDEIVLVGFIGKIDQ